MSKPLPSNQLVRWLPVFGCITTGIIYAGIGVIALLSFFKVRNGGADESSMMMILNNTLIGRIALWVVLLGTLCYIGWRFYEAITDPYKYGKDGKGITRRMGIGLSTVADLLIVYNAVRVLLGLSHIQTDGQPAEEREMVGTLLQEGYGDELVSAIGVVYFATAFVQLFYGMTRGYKERLRIEKFSPVWKTTIHVLAWAGYFARGIILGIIGFFFVKAGFSGKSSFVVNTDKAFDFIGDNVGHVWFILVALATICYGAFMVTQGVVYNVGKSTSLLKDD